MSETNEYARGAPARDGDLGIYEQCHDPNCHAHREGFNHAHLVEVQRQDDEASATDGIELP